jgi:hypothetical protein
LIVRNQVIAYLVLLALVDVFIPVPILALVLLWVVVRRPRWFLEMVRDVYGGS